MYLYFDGKKTISNARLLFDFPTIRALGLFMKKHIRIIMTDLLKMRKKNEILIESKTFRKPFVTWISFISKSQQILVQRCFFVRDFRVYVICGGDYSSKCLMASRNPTQNFLNRFSFHASQWSWAMFNAKKNLIHSMSK